MPEYFAKDELSDFQKYLKNISKIKDGWNDSFFILNRDKKIVGCAGLGINKSKKIAVIEQENNVAQHTSGRNTGKVHAPYLYNPEKKKLFANAAFHGYEMWKEYAKLQNLPFKEDGVIEVALDEKGIKVLEKYLKWGKQNGLEEKDIELIDKNINVKYVFDPVYYEKLLLDNKIYHLFELELIEKLLKKINKIYYYNNFNKYNFSTDFSDFDHYNADLASKILSEIVFPDVEKNYIVLDVLFRKTKNLSHLTIEKNIQLMKNQKKLNTLLFHLQESQ